MSRLVPLLGRTHLCWDEPDPVNIEAAELVGHLHDALESSNYRGHDLEVFLTRLVFCLFADDTGIFEPRDIFLDFLETRTREDGADTGPLIAQLFEILNTPRRSTPKQPGRRFLLAFPMGWMPLPKRHRNPNAG